MCCQKIQIQLPRAEGSPFAFRTKAHLQVNASFLYLKRAIKQILQTMELLWPYNHKFHQV